MAIEIVKDEDDPGREEVQKRNRIRADFQLAMRQHPQMVERTLDILHFFGPAQNERDIALQNAGKSWLHAAGLWGDSDEDRENIVRKLTGVNVHRSLWARIFGRK